MSPSVAFTSSLSNVPARGNEASCYPLLRGAAMSPWHARRRQPRRFERIGRVTEDASNLYSATKKFS
jgi:hypothetical protein